MNAPNPAADSILDEAAAQWLCEREEGFTPERARAFADWCARDPRHSEAVVRIERTLALLDDLPDARAPLIARFGGSGANTVQADAPRHKTIRFPRMAWASGIAAALVLGLVAWLTMTDEKPVAARYATGAAAQGSMVLPDGSVMDLNTESDVLVRFTDEERRIVLNQGEGHFQVARDSKRPFIVTAGSVSVRAVGTAFNVRLAGDEVDVLVVEGKVELGRGSAPAQAVFSGNAPLLVAGERTQVAGDTIMSSSPRIEKLDAQSIRGLLTWQNPLTDFVDVPLRDVVVRLNRRNATRLVVEDAELGRRKIGGMIALDQADAFVRLLEQDGDIIVERRGGNEVFLRRAR